MESNKPIDPNNLPSNENKGLNRRKALRNILGSSGALLGLPLTLRAWGQPSSYNQLGANSNTSKLSDFSSAGPSHGIRNIESSDSFRFMSMSPSMAPSMAPSLAPSMAPSLAPSTAPTMSPIVAPSMSPTMSPIVAPTPSPTLSPTTAPSCLEFIPTSAPTPPPS